MGFEHILVERSGDFATITMNRPQKRNALSLDHMRELIRAFSELGDSALRRLGRFIVTVAKSPDRSTRMCSNPIALSFSLLRSLRCGDALHRRP